MIKISIIIPVYNMEDYLDECLESVTGQTLRETEILCVNDGSKDKSCQKLKMWAGKDSRIQILDLKHQGVAVARNTAIRKAQGEFIAFMDADDRYPNRNVLEKMYNAAIENGVNIAGGCFSDFDGNGKINTEYSGIYSGYIFRDNRVMDYREYQFDYGYPRFIYNREFLLKYKLEFPLLTYYEDPPFMVKAMTLAEVFYAMADVTYCYRKGHKTKEWNRTLISDFLCAVDENMKWSKEYQLEDLKRLTIHRITKEYREAILYEFSLENTIREKYAMVVKENTDSCVMQQMLLEGLYCTIQKKEEELQRIKRSFSYRIGSMFTYIPRRARKYIMGKERFIKG